MTTSANDNKSMLAMTLGGTLAQIGMVVAGHFNEFVKNNVFAIGGMGISLAFGALWAARSARSKAGAFGGGAVVGGISAIIGIAASVLMGDTPAGVLAFGTAGSAATGGLGGLMAYLLSQKKAAPMRT